MPLFLSFMILIYKCNTFVSTQYSLPLVHINGVVYYINLSFSSKSRGGGEGLIAAVNAEQISSMNDIRDPSLEYYVSRDPPIPIMPSYNPEPRTQPPKPFRFVNKSDYSLIHRFNQE